MNPRALLTTVFLMLAGSLQSHAQDKAEVIVYGSTPGGYCAAGVGWTIGREGEAEIGESFAGKQYPKQKQRKNIDGFDADGKPLPLITTTDAGPDDAGDDNVMTYTFRLSMTKDATNRIGHPHHVPYRSILPRPNECDNLLVPVALSCTHVAMSALRIEATWMLIGQSSGIAAALAAKQDLPVQKLPYETLRPRLLAQKQALDLPENFQRFPNPKE